LSEKCFNVLCSVKSTAAMFQQEVQNLDTIFLVEYSDFYG